MDHRTIERDGVALHCAFTGPTDGPLVVLLHGFPARWSTWRRTMRDLGDAGHLVVAPDLRGYGESSKPAQREAYSMNELADDVAHVVRAWGRDRARMIAGHDVGGGVAWITAMRHPDVVERVATLSSVHPVGFERQIRRWSQVKKSWYAFFFLLPSVPEWWLARDDFGFVRRSLADDGLADDVVEDLLEGIRPPGALHAAIDGYRQSFADGAKKRIAMKKVDLPVLSVWGDRERHLDPELATPPADWVANAEVAHVPEAGHWVQHDAPERVSELLVRHACETHGMLAP